MANLLLECMVECEQQSKILGLGFDFELESVKPILFVRDKDFLVAALLIVVIIRLEFRPFVGIGL